MLGDGTCEVCGEKGTVTLTGDTGVCFACFRDGVVWAAQKAKEHRWRVKMAEDLIESTRSKGGP